MTDSRTTPARVDLAAAHLRGRVHAARFVEGTLHRALRGRVALRAGPDFGARLETELLLGENFAVYDIAGGWAWGQSSVDDYVGYVCATELGEAAIEPDHRVTALMTPLYGAPELKSPPRDMLPMNAKVKILEAGDRFTRIAPDGFVFARHLAPLGAYAPDWVAVAERFLGVPYVWGGKTAAGIDCSGLVQTALEAGGIAAPRDADMQENALGRSVPVAADRTGLARGDLVCWLDHIGVMLDATRILHANAFYMETAVEPLADAVRRIANPITAIKQIESR